MHLDSASFGCFIATEQLALTYTAGGGAIKGPRRLMLLALTFNLWIVWLFSSHIFSPAIMTAKVTSDENMMKQQFIFFLSFLPSHSISRPPSPSCALSLSWHRVIEQWGTAEF